MRLKKCVLSVSTCALISLLNPLPVSALGMAEISQVQDVTVKGKVTDSNGETIIGANVLEKGTTNGIITDMDGNFTLKVSSGAVLEISYIGYVTQTVKVTSQTNLNIVLKEDTETLDEVVVVGYGTMKKSDLSGASASIGEQSIKGSIISNLDQSLQGRVSGVTAITTSGAPGSSSSIRVRGQATINANAEPLYVIDGVIVQSSGSNGQSYGLSDALGSNASASTVSPISSIDPSDIVSMEVLKDASATAIYGAQGANGVILITTKRGKAGEAKFSYNGMMAVQRQTRRLDVMDLREFADYYNDFVKFDGKEEKPELMDPSLLGVGTNWQDAIFQTALQHQHQVSAQGGNEKVKYYVSGSYMDQDGTIIGSNFNRYSFRTNLDAQLKPWLKLGLNVSFSSTDDDLKLADSDRGIINYSLQAAPDRPIYDMDGNYSSIQEEGNTNPNPIALAMMDQILLKRQKLYGNLFAEFSILKNLAWRSELGFDYGYNKGEYFYPTVDLGNWVRESNTSAVQKQNSTYWQLKNYLTYNGSIGKHSFTAMIGQECWESNYDRLRVENVGLPSDDVHNPALGTGTPAVQSGFGSSAMASFFTRETYSYDNRYSATYTYRMDGSSNFGPNNRWAGFHSIAASWRFSNEEFFKKILHIINNGKIRIGWGQTGNANIGGYLWGNSMFKVPTGLGLGFRPYNIPNPSVSWETQEQLNLGIDLAFLNDRINLVVDLYKKVSKDMLMPLQLPSYMGTQGNASSILHSPMGNYGDIENKGLEISLNTHPIVGDFQWDSDFQISFNKNKLRALDGTENAQIVGYGQNNDVVSVSSVGSSLYDFYGYVCDGVYKDLEDIMTSPKPEKYPKDGVFNRNNTVWVGDIKYKDLNDDGVIDENDRTKIGSPLPKFTFGWTNTFRYKNFDLSLFINGSYGNKIFNYLGMNLSDMKSPWANQLSVVNDRTKLEPIDPNKDYSNGVIVNGVVVNNWYDDITNVRVANESDIPRATLSDPNDNDRISDRYIEDGSYIRLKNITLGYTFNKKIIKRINIESLRLYMNIQNLCTITGYSGYDPEVGIGTSNANVYGLDNGRYPSPTVYSFGMNLTF